MELPAEFLRRMRALLGDEYDEFLKSYDTKINKGVRINTLKADESVAAILGLTERVPWCETGYYLPESTALCGKHPYHAAGAVYFQEPSAMSAGEGLPLDRGSCILDLCAAPGGKTTQLAARMNNTGLLISNETVPRRAKILAENADRMGLTNTIVTNETPQRLAERFEAYFDGVMVDAPCSGEGMFRKEPAAAEAWSIAHTLSCAARQKNILDDAYTMLKPGGYLMYSTCTFAPCENEEVVEYMTEKYDMQIMNISQLEALSPGIGDFPGAERCRRIFPHREKGEGHFAALLRKRGETDTVSAPRTETPTRRRSAGGDIETATEMYRRFERDVLKTPIDGEFVLFGDTLWAMPEKFPIDGLRITRCGLCLGTLKRGRFEPAHALSHAFAGSEYSNVLNLRLGADEVEKYMHGEVIPGEVSGRCVVCCDGFPLGWGKADGKAVKNHYPKFLRI